MKYLLYFLLILSFHFFSLQASENAERRLIHITAEGQKVTFFLDNGWFFKGSVAEFKEYQLKSLDRFVGQMVQITDNQCKPGFRLAFEQGHHFTVALPYETYTMLPTLVAVDIEKLLGFTWYAVFTFSDGSAWETPPLSTIYPAIDYWTLGDHVMITKSTADSDVHFLVNVDISNSYIQVHKRDNLEEWLSLEDFRTMKCTEINTQS